MIDLRKKLLLASAVLALSSLTPALSEPLRFVGVNLAGAEFRGNRIPGALNKDYIYPSSKDVDYFMSQGMNTFRVPFRWERMQLNLGWELEDDELEQLDKTVRYITDKGGYTLLDPHNYGRYYGKLIGSKQVPASALADFWRVLALRYKDNDKVIFGLMNEPHGISASDWREIAEVSITAIRDTGAKNLILVPGTNWTGAHSWMTSRGKPSNGEVFRDLKDPANNMMFEVHQYLDGDYSGTKDFCQSEDIGVEKLTSFTKWLRENNQRGFLGEFGVGSSPVCLEALNRMLKYVSDNADVWGGWTYWAAGPWWGNYPFSIQPSPEGDRPQMKVLQDRIGRP
ncbi:glycoside hydrolase family 5 protein [Microvirga pudoricolor]|uniref:glycoside hydrolase family 5 protein n=1 Tax=Microvirga pudoricolor TaxID=2778729 RepID=UPI00194EB6D7|nr:glycoside hydrolase family 5 protein [Microvirga pudoricolor]MBM6593250.1 glycoside hydrolase family 5 protein [Microvirga pudoricolor]